MGSESPICSGLHRPSSSMKHILIAPVFVDLVVHLAAMFRRTLCGAEDERYNADLRAKLFLLGNSERCIHECAFIRRQNVNQSR
jgi:hypothetical protein